MFPRSVPAVAVCLVACLLPSGAWGQAQPAPLITWEDLLPARGGCGARALGIALPPGGSKRLHRLEPAVANDAFSYQWFLDWKMATPDSLRPRRAWRDSSGVIRT